METETYYKRVECKHASVEWAQGCSDCHGSRVVYVHADLPPAAVLRAALEHDHVWVMKAMAMDGRPMWYEPEQTIMRAKHVECAAFGYSGGDPVCTATPADVTP